jgi:two-component system, LytTR family, sensor kinase
MLPSTRRWTRSHVPLPARSSPASAQQTLDATVPPKPLTGVTLETSQPFRLGFMVFIVWTLIALCTAAQYFFFFDPDDGPVPLTHALVLGFGLWYTWGLLGLIPFGLSQHFPLGKHHWPTRLAVHMACCLAITVVKIFIDYPIIKGFYCPHPEKLTLPVFWRMVMGGAFLRYLLYYWATIGVIHALGYYGKYREGELRAAQLETGLTRARLQLLKTQLQPHFLFNTLNAISALLHADVEAADHMLARLGDLMRLVLEDFDVQEAPLVRELEIARSYLEIEQARLGPRLNVEWDIAADTSDALVPTFLLQPLIENSVHHGIAPRIGPGRIEIRVRRVSSELRLEVRDDGPGLPPGAEASGGVGIANTRARLLHLYGTAQRLEIKNLPQGGCVAKIVLPFHELADEFGATDEAAP